MKLESRYKSTVSDQYVCELTKELDELAKIKSEHLGFYCHYILVDDYCSNEKCLAIRVPGGTVGAVYIDDNDIITKIVIDTDYVVKSYPKNINKKVLKFVGEKIELPNNTSNTEQIIRLSQAEYDAIPDSVKCNNNITYIIYDSNSMEEL